LFQRKPKLIKADSLTDLFAATWKSQVVSLVVGLCLALMLLQLRSMSASSSWREKELAIAKSDLMAIKTLAQIATDEMHNDPTAAGKLAELPADVQTAIQSLSKGAELIWSVVDDLALSKSLRSEAFPRFTPSWIVEPNGYTLLRLVSQFEEGLGLGNQLAMMRRFSVAESATLGFWDWFGAASIGCGTLIIGSLYAKTKNGRKRFLESLTNWSKLSLQADSPALETGMSMMANLDPGVSNILKRASERMHQRLESIQHSVEQSSRVMSAMPIGVLAFDQNLKLLFVNRAGIELLYLSASFQLGQTLIEVIRQPTVVNLIQQVAIGKQIQEVEFELPLSKVTLRLRAHPLSDPNESPAIADTSGVLLTVTDETRIKQLENARRDFTANVSHELKTPLSAIKAYAETLLMGALDDEEARHRFVERIAEQANRLDSLIRDLLRLTKLQSHPDKPSLTELWLDDVLKTCVEEHRTIGQAKKITIDTDSVEPNLRVEADLESLRTVIGNLLGNAVRYNHSDGWVRVSTRKELGEIVLIIADSGIGIPPEDLVRIFERFYRVEKARSQDSGGTGLGLSIVKHLVQQIGAEIQVSSILGKGSVFELKLKSSETC